MNPLISVGSLVSHCYFYWDFSFHILGTHQQDVRCDAHDLKDDVHGVLLERMRGFDIFLYQELLFFMMMIMMITIFVQAIMQLVCNPLVGNLTLKIGYKVPLCIGNFVLFLCSLSKFGPSVRIS